MQLIVDDHDDHIVYTGSWDPGAVGNEYNTTSHAPNSSPASLNFRFHGTGVWLYATNQPQINTLYTCAIDDNTTGPFGLPINEGVDQYSYILCEFPDLSSEEHSVSFNITFQGSRGRLYFDYIVYEDSSAMTSSSMGPPSTLPTVTETGPNIHPSFVQTGSHGTAPNVEIIVGTLFGVLSLIFGVVVAFLCIRRHRKGYKASHRRQTPLRIYTTAGLHTPIVWDIPSSAPTSSTPFTQRLIMSPFTNCHQQSDSRSRYSFASTLQSPSSPPPSVLRVYPISDHTQSFASTFSDPFGARRHSQTSYSVHYASLNPGLGRREALFSRYRSRSEGTLSFMFAESDPYATASRTGSDYAYTLPLSRAPTSDWGTRRTSSRREESSVTL